MTHHVHRYVDAALQQLRANDMMRSPLVDAEMRDTTVPPQDGWIGWKPVPSSVRDDDLDELEALVGAKFPPSYRTFLKYKHFCELTESGVRFLRHPIDSWKRELKQAYEGDLPEHLNSVGLIPFGSETFMDAGPVCFDTRFASADGDCPVVFWDHDWSGTEQEIRPLFSSCARMFSCLALIAESDIDFIYHQDDDSPDLVGRKKERMKAFLEADPEGAGGPARDYWTSWGIDPDAKTISNPFTGCLLGTAVGDALGLPYEGMTPERGARLFPDVGRHHLFFGKGMVSDDTEHACMTAQALLRGAMEARDFQRRLGWGLRWWLMGLPAGVGLATLKAIVKLWLGFGVKRCGVFSAGNGPAMRSAIIGLALGDAPERLTQYVRDSTRLTHTDPKAYCGALAVALAAHVSARSSEVSAEAYLTELGGLLAKENAREFMDLMHKAAESAMRNEPVGQFAQSIGSRRGISGYIYHTVPCVVQVWLRHTDDFAGAVREMIMAGGDTDTTAAIVGGIVGARVGKAGIPQEMLAGIVEWPRSIRWMKALGQALSDRFEKKMQARSPEYFWPGLVFRNLFFLFVVLAHGFRRLGPPY